MAQKLLLMLAALWLVTGCGKEKRRDPKAEIVSETLQHIEKMEAAGARLGKLSELTPAAQVATDLRFVARDLSEWQREYRTLRAKMLLRNVSQDQHRQVNRQYQTAVEDFRLKFDQAERRVSRRSDTRIFFVDLHRVRQLVLEL
jgi:hypothetical protein